MLCHRHKLHFRALDVFRCLLLPLSIFYDHQDSKFRLLSDVSWFQSIWSGLLLSWLSFCCSSTPLPSSFWLLSSQGSSTFMLFVLSSQRFLLKHSSQALIYNATMYEEQVDYFLTKLLLKLCALDRALYEHESTIVTKGACLMEIGKWTLTNMEHFNIEHSNL